MTPAAGPAGYAGSPPARGGPPSGPGGPPPGFGGPPSGPGGPPPGFGGPPPGFGGPPPGFEGPPGPGRPAGPRPGLGDLWRLLRGHGRLITFATGLTAVGSLIGLAQPLLVRGVIDGAGSGHVPGVLIVVLVAVFLLEAAIDTWGHFLLERTGQRVLLGLRHRLIGHLLRLRIRVFDEARIGDLLSRSNADTMVVRDAVAYSLTSVVTSTIGVLAAIGLMVWLNPLLFGLVVIAVVLAGSVVLTALTRVRSVSEQGQASVGRMSADLERALTAIRTVRASNAEERECRRIGEHADEAYRAGLRMARLSAVIAPASQLAVQGSVLLVLLAGGVLVARGTTSLGDLVAFLLYATYLVMPLSQLIESAQTIQRGLGALTRVNVVFTMPREDDGTAPDAGTVPAAPGPNPGLVPVAERDSDLAVASDPDPVPGNGVQDALQAPALEFRDVWFSYGPRPVLRGVSFVVPARGQVALVGPSGAGKSTVLGLIERFYEPDAGEILLGGVPLGQVERARTRRQVNLVEQDAPVLCGTLRDNIVYACPDATDADISAVVDVARLAGLVRRLPAGLDTDVGDHGVMLSGGERQRVAVARALLAAPGLLLLDEPTSQMDAVNERALTRVMADIAARRALLVIAHRISTVRASDRILVLDDGILVAAGRHEELLSSSAHYARLAAGSLDRTA
ncbi:ABC transporter ATP-binding protein [Parafrankia elaeagni]|uniref:ABC transporter ATP-binding protein n=1 Tax=Parafrankia elaeagni TaxID=222534 RepID=UPI0003784385|nr:ABC transporter ATP-binding protein [Parafrankia elaeagni]